MSVASAWPGLTYPELLFSLNEEKTILEESLQTSCLLKMSTSILDYKLGVSHAKFLF